MPKFATTEITVSMTIDVDGAPNSYGPNDRDALDFESDAHESRPPHSIVGYLTMNDDGRTPIVQSADDPFPGFFVSTTAYADIRNPRREDPRRYVNAAEINYTVLASAAHDRGVQQGDFCVVHSLRTNFVTYAIVGDAGHSSGAEGSLALLQRLGYKVKNGKSGGEDAQKIVVRYFAGTNPTRKFFFTQAEVDSAAGALDLDIDFSGQHQGNPGKLVFSVPGHTGRDSSAPRILPFAPIEKADDPPAFPGHFVGRDSADGDAVTLIQKRLHALAQAAEAVAEDLDIDGSFGPETEAAVRRFQGAHRDLDGAALEIDGQVGSLTWDALFGRNFAHFPGRLIMSDSNDFDAVTRVQQRLQDLGYLQESEHGRVALEVDGQFGPQTARAVELFQVRHTDLDGHPLEVDSRVGIETWGSLFGRESIRNSQRSPAKTTNPTSPASSTAPADISLLAETLVFASGEVGVLEQPINTNRGPRVEQYQASVHISPGEPWCAAFVYFSFQQTAATKGVPNPVIQTGSVHEHWNRARQQGVKTVLHLDAINNPAKVKPGMIFIISTSDNTGHTGLVESVAGSRLVTIEGNTNDGGSREGIGVFRRHGRSIDSINRGFIDYGA